MQLTQSKTIEILCTLLIFVALFSAAFHAKDVVARYEKPGKDDNNSVARKISGDWHNHIDKFSVKSMNLTKNSVFGADSRSLKKQIVGNKRLQKLLD